MRRLFLRTWGQVMTRTVRFACCAALLSCHPLPAGAGQLPTGQSTPVTITATIEAIDQANRAVTLKGPKGNSVEIKVADQLQGFNTLKVGDQVTATYFEAFAVNVRKPGDPAPPAGPATTIERKERAPDAQARKQQTFTVTIQAVDPKTPSLTVKGPQGRSVELKVSDAKRLENVKVGDTVDVTYFESLMVKVSRAPK